MGAIAPVPKPWTRRMAIALAVLPLGIGLSRANSGETLILVVSRKRLLNDTNHAQALLKAEIELTAELQHRIDTVKAELNAEEQELTRLRPTLDRAVFDERVAVFERKIRSQRREAQQNAAVLQSAFRAERLKLVEALGPLLEEVRKAHGASVILNAEKTLASDPTLDATDEVIARFNAEVPPPVVPDPDSFAPDPVDGPPDGELPPQ